MKSPADSPSAAPNLRFQNNLLVGMPAESPLFDGLARNQAQDKHGRPRSHSGRAMTSDLDVYRAAKILVDEHGRDAPIRAAQRIDDLRDRGDLDGCAVWRRILKACDELLATEPPEGGVMH